MVNFKEIFDNELESSVGVEMFKLPDFPQHRCGQAVSTDSQISCKDQCLSISALVRCDEGDDGFFMPELTPRDKVSGHALGASTAARP